jgi:2-dehydro-3-deoxyglucarate aldolase
MLEHADALPHLDEILAVPGIDATFIGPYDLSASLGVPGQLDHPDVQDAQQRILRACLNRGIAPGYHVVPLDPDQVSARLADGFRFLALGLDTGLLASGGQALLAAGRAATES